MMTEEERKARRRETVRRWKEKHPNYHSEYRNANKARISERNKQYRAENIELVRDRPPLAGKKP